MQSFPVWAKVCPSPEAPPLANRCCYACECNTSQSQDGSSATGRVVQRKRASEECSWGQACSCPGFLVLLPTSNMEGKGRRTQAFRAMGPEFYKGAGGTVGRRCFLVAQLMGQEEIQIVLCEKKAFGPCPQVFLSMSPFPGT